MKVIRLACMVCALGAMFLTVSSCKKQNDQTTFNLGISEWQSEDDERMYIDFQTHKPKWNGMDEVMVYNLDFEDGENSVFDVYRTNAAAEGQDRASFVGSVGPVKDGYFTFYPAQITGSYDGDAMNVDNRESFHVDPVQHLTIFKKGNNWLNTIDPLGFAVAHNPTNLTTFDFRHIFGMLRLAFRGEENWVIDHVEIIDNRHNLSGDISLKLPRVDTEELTTLINYLKNSQLEEFANLYQSYAIEDLGFEVTQNQYLGRMLTLDCSSHPEQCTFQDGFARDMYLGIRPGALTDGFKLKVYFQGDIAVYVKQFIEPNYAKCSKPGVIRTINPTFFSEELYNGEPNAPGVFGSWAEVEAM